MTPVPAPKAGEAPPPVESLATGEVNFRIRDGELQISVPVTVNVAGLGEKYIVQARGGFVKDGDKVVYKPNALYVGSCPIERIPFVAGYVQDKFLGAQPIPEDIATAWAKVAGVTIEGSALTVTMQ